MKQFIRQYKGIFDFRKPHEKSFIRADLRDYYVRESDRMFLLRLVRERMFSTTAGPK